MTKQCAGSARKVRNAQLQRFLNLALCGLALGAILQPRSSAQQISFSDFNAPAGTPSQTSTTRTPIAASSSVLFCFNKSGNQTTGRSYIQDYYPAALDPNGGSGGQYYALQVTQSAMSQDASVWHSIPQNVANGFTV